VHELDSLKVVLRVCKLCHSEFEVERKPGARRQYCYRCEPPGFALVKVRGRLKLRRRPPAFSTAAIRRDAAADAAVPWAVIRGGGGDAAA
jgi:hypothetical protein